MADQDPITLNTLHEDLQAGFAEVKGELRDLKVALVAGFHNMPSREGQEEMVRLLRENNRLQEERFAQLDGRIRDQHLEVLNALRAMAEGIATLSGDIKGRGPWRSSS